MFIIIEGLDRTGKSTVAELYKKKGYEVIHMSAPSKKYKEPGYTGPSYLDDMLEMYLQCDGKDIIFDRSPYGEMVWPHVYGREPMLSEEDLEILQEFEERNNATKILMIDPDVRAHWQRCVDNKEPMNQNQFKVASALFNKLAHKYNFAPKQLKDFQVETKDSKQTSTSTKQEDPVLKGQVKNDSTSTIADTGRALSETVFLEEKQETELDKLEKANAIRDVLAKPIFKPAKKNDKIFKELEEDVRDFLKNKLSTLLGSNTSVVLTIEEIQILKVYCKRIKEKLS